MRIWLAGVLVCGILCPSLATEPNFNALYVPPKDGAPPKIVEYDTGTVSAVLGAFEARPADCPQGDFWVSKKDQHVVNCGSGNAYRLVPPSFVLDGYEDALKLEKVTGGTDDGGPMAPKEPIK
jgi:hypothetical protein